MRKLFHIGLVFFVVFYLQKAKGQNLVLNPSFENISVSCGGFGGAGYTNLVTWDNPDPTDTCSTPDWFSTCLSSFFPTAAPNSWLGSQSPRTGQAYAGLILYDATTSSYREYVEGKLSSPMVAGQTYCVSFYISLADTVPFATDRIGVYFSNAFTQFPVSHCVSTVPLPFTPQLQYTGPVLTDEDNWVLLSWNYVATGGELFFTIGNFFNNASTTTINVGGSFLNPFAYYFIDDVSVTAGPCCISDIVSVAPMCVGDPAVTLSVGTPGGTFSGPGVNATTGVFNPATAGTGTATITYSLSCGGSSSINIVVNPCATLSLCSGSGSTATVSGGTGPYQWQTGVTTTPCVTGLGFCSGPFTVAGPPVTTWTTFTTGTTATMPGTYPVQVIDANGSVTTIADATAYAALLSCSSCPPLTVNISSQVNVACFGGSTGSFNTSTTGGASPWDYSLMNGATTVATFINVSGTQAFTGLPAGTYTLNVMDDNGCPGTTTITITQPSGSTTTANAGPIQSGCSTSVTMAGNTATVGTGTWTLVSGAGTITTPSSPTTTVTGLGIGSNVFMWTISNPPCSPTTDTVTIINTGGPSISTSSQTNVNCNGGSTGAATVVGLGGSGSYTYLWTGGAGTSASASGLSAGTYTVTVTDGAGCSGTTLVNITQPSAITGAVNTTIATCGTSDGTATASISGGSGTFTYLWSPGGATTSSLTGIPAGVYSVTITDSLGCVYSASGTVGSVGGPSVNAGADVTIIAGASTILTGTATTGGSFSWSPASTLSCDTCATTIATPDATTTYTLTVTNNGCTSFDVVTVFVEIECGEVFVPNVFSPNNDGQNDELKVYGNCITNFEFVIFDRWGNKVFDITNPSLAWDGRYNGKLLDAAVFVYYLKGTVKGVDISKHGNITLVK